MQARRITEISADNRKVWDAVVKSMNGYEAFYLHGYLSAFQAEDAANGIPVLLYYENGTDRAVSAVFKRDIALDKKFEGKIEKGRYYDLTTPYGYGGFWGNICDYDSLNKTYYAYCSSRHYVCEFVRFGLFGDYRKYYAGNTVSRTHNVVRSLEPPLEEIWMDFKPKVRKNVRRAGSYHLEALADSDGTCLDDFLRIYYATMDRAKAEESYYFSRNFYENISRMTEHSVYFHVLYEEKIISSELVLYGAENAYSFLGGTDRTYFAMRPNDFLKYEIIKWCKQKGLKNFVLGGGYGADDGIFQYKKCFAPHGILDFYTGHQIFEQDMYDRLTDIRALENPECTNTPYFPAYRA